MGPDGSDPAALGPAAAVVGQGGDVADQGDLETGHLQGADGRLTAGTRTAHQHLDLAHALLQGAAGGGFGRGLGGEGGALAGALEAAGTGGGPADHLTGGVGDRDDGVVEGALDVRHAVGDVALGLLGAGLLGGLGHGGGPAAAGR